MIIIRNEENEIVDLFDTVNEFKVYIEQTLNEMEEGLLADGLGTIFNTNIEKQNFYNQLKMYQEMTENKIEVK